MNCDGYRYNPECVMAVGYDRYNQGYVHQGSYNN